MMRTGSPATLLGRAGFTWALTLFAFWRAAPAFLDAAASGVGNYQLGDWLINYTGGPTRRGLAGALALAVLPHGTPGLVTLAWIVVALGAVPVGFGLWHLHRRGYAWGDQALLLGPAALLFPLWDAGAFGRKEVLACIALGLLVAAARGASRGWAGTLVVAAALVWLLALGAWEGCLFVLPAVLYVAGRTPAGRSAQLLFGGLSAAGAALALLYPGTVAQRPPVCDALAAHGLNTSVLCAGAVQYLGQSQHDAWAYVVQYARQNVGLLPWAALGLLPLLVTRWWRQKPWLVGCSVVAIAPAFLVGIDVGRWVSLFIVALTFCWMADDADGPAWTPAPAVTYCTAWGLPHATNFASWPGMGALHQFAQLLSGW